MQRLSIFFRNLRAYFSSLLARRKRQKQNKKDDPFIYPHF